MRLQLTALAFGCLVLACEGPDPDRDGFVVVDEGARAAGIAIEVSGERHSGELPVAIPEGAEAEVVRPGGAEPLVVAPGELLEVVGPDGELRYRDVPRDQLWVGGDEASVSAFAELIGARARRLPGGGWAVEGPDAFILASLMGSAPGLGAISMVPPADRPDVIDIGLFVDRGPVARADTPALEGATPDAASLVGLYVHGDVHLLLDAAGGWSLWTDAPERPVRAGTYRPRPGGVDFVPNDGGSVAVMELTGDALVDDLGVSFTP